MSKPEEILAEIKADLKRVTDEVKRTAEDALKQAQSGGTVAAETKAKADELLAKQGEIGGKVVALETKLESLEARNQEMEQHVASRRAPGQDTVKSMGQQVAEADAVKVLAAAGGKGRANVAVNMAITSASGSAGALIAPDRLNEVITLPRVRLPVRALLSQGRTTSNLVQYAKQTLRSNLAEMVTEGAQKPESNYTWGEADAPVRTMAHWVHVSRQALDDAGVLQEAIDGELRYGLDLVEEQQILKGDGTGQNLSGLVPEASAYVPALVVQDETRIDVIRLAMLQASLAGYPADGIILSEVDWAAIELLKDGENRYLWAQPRAPLATPGLWGLPVAISTSMEEGEFLVGALRMAATIYDRMDVEVLISSEDRDNFIKNMLTVRAEKRLALAVKRPAALITGEFPAVSG